MPNSLNALATLDVDGRAYRYYRLGALSAAGIDLDRLPFSLKILLENLLRNEDGQTVTADDVRGLAAWDPGAEPSREIAFRPGRVLLQDFTGVPAVVDLAAMRDAMKRMGGDPTKINPLQPVELVIDHSVQVDEAGTPRSFLVNAEYEFARNRERYAFLRWGQTAFENFRVVPPDTGIVHQVNLEYLARVVITSDDGKAEGASDGPPLAYPDTLVGTDSHTTMINGLGVLGWGVGGIEAEAAMLGQPVSMLVPQVVGFRLKGTLREGATATDLVLTVTEMLRKRGVVGKFVEFYGEGLAGLPLADRATIANMAPEYGATCGIFPIDAETLRYLKLSGRPGPLIRLVEEYAKAQGLFHGPGTPEASYSDTMALDLATVEPSLAGPKRPPRQGDAGQRQGVVRHRPASHARGASGPRGAPAGGHGRREGPAPPGGRGRRRHGRRFRGPPCPGARQTRRGPPRHRSRLGRHRGHHELHQYVEPLGHDRRRPARQEGRGKGPDDQALGQGEPRAGLQGRDGLLPRLGPRRLPRQAPVQPRRATAARPASATPARCRPRSPRRSTTTTSSSPRCSAATATSRAASIPRSAPITSPRPPWSSPTPWLAAWTST